MSSIVDVKDLEVVGGQTGDVKTGDVKTGDVKTGDVTIKNIEPGYVGGGSGLGKVLKELPITSFVDDGTKSKSVMPISNPMPVPCQKFGVVAIVRHERFMESGYNETVRTAMALNFLGCFDDTTQANAYIRKLQDTDMKMFDIYTVQMGEFVPYPPPRLLDDTRFVQKDLQEVFNTYKLGLDNAKKSLSKRMAKEAEESDILKNATTPPAETPTTTTETSSDTIVKKEEV